MRRTLGVACACVSGFMFNLSLNMHHCELWVDFIFHTSLVMHSYYQTSNSYILRGKIAEIKLQGVGYLHLQKQPFEI